MRHSLSQIGGVAAIVGGAMWVAKGGAILAGQEQPPVVFGAAPAFFALALLPLLAALRGRPERLEKIGAFLAYVAGVLGAVTAVAALVAWNDDMPAVFNATMGIATLSIVVALVALGIVLRRTAILAQPWRTLPLALGIFVPALLLGGVLSAADERLLEIPIVFLGLAWILLGYATVTRSARQNARSCTQPSPVRTSGEVARSRRGGGDPHYPLLVLGPALRAILFVTLRS